MHSSLPQQLRNFRFSDSKLLYNAFLWLEESCLRVSDAVIAICPDLRDYALAVGVEPQRLLMIENSIFDDVRLRARPPRSEPPRMPHGEPDPGRPWVLYAGTFEAYQGLDVVLRSFPEVLRRHPEAQLVLAGGTEEQVKAMQELADELQLGPACVFTGRVSKTQAMRYSRQARVLVSPRVSGTNTPLKVYEQLASGVPLVATRIWSHTQVLDESVCFLVEPEASSIAAGILAALDDQGGAAQRAANAKGLYEKEYARPIYEGKIRRLLEVIG
jgi:glycosyltransferase involved in cell wall biosynthesis